MLELVVALVGEEEDFVRSEPRLDATNRVVVKELVELLESQELETLEVLHELCEHAV